MTLRIIDVLLFPYIRQKRTIVCKDSGLQGISAALISGDGVHDVP